MITKNPVQIGIDPLFIRKTSYRLRSKELGGFGAHAAAEDLLLITRDAKRIKINFPTVETISP